MRKISFQKLANRQYSLSVELHMINWFLKSGVPYYERQGRWNVEGVSKFVLGYSANNHHSETMYTKPMNIDNIDLQVDSILLRTLVKTTNIKCINDWRKAERISLDRFRYFYINEEIPKLDRWNTWYLHSAIRKLNDFVGKKLNPSEYNTKSYSNPKISSIYLHVNGGGYCVDCHISYQSEGYKFNYNDYNLSFRQKEDESIDMFIYRVHQSINNLIIHDTPELITDRNE